MSKTREVTASEIKAGKCYRVASTHDTGEYELLDSVIEAEAIADPEPGDGGERYITGTWHYTDGTTGHGMGVVLGDDEVTEVPRRPTARRMFWHEDSGGGEVVEPGPGDELHVSDVSPARSFTITRYRARVSWSVGPLPGGASRVGDVECDHEHLTEQAAGECAAHLRRCISTSPSPIAEVREAIADVHRLWAETLITEAVPA